MEYLNITIWRKSGAQSVHLAVAGACRPWPGAMGGQDTVKMAVRVTGQTPVPRARWSICPPGLSLSKELWPGR